LPRTVGIRFVSGGRLNPPYMVKLREDLLLAVNTPEVPG
jgi:hypothetical protein